MNKILQLKGKFKHQTNRSGGGSPSLPKGKQVNVSHLKDLLRDLQQTLAFWNEEKNIEGAIVSVYYYHVVAKSNRIKGLLCKGSELPDDSICGSKFYGVKPQQHVFTHYVELDVLRESIRRLSICIDIIEQQYNGTVTADDVENVSNNKVSYYHPHLPKTHFLRIVVDSYYVEKFTIDKDEEQITEQAIVTIYKTKVRTADLLRKFGIDMISAKTIDETTLRLTPDEFELLRQKAPYLIAMRTSDLSKITLEDIYSCEPEVVTIPAPKNEPIVGVIDTLFYEDVYFKEWVDYTRMVDPDIPTTSSDCDHGTAVTSLIVDGPTINPDMDDGCGRFRVRHFGVAIGTRFSSFTVLRAIREIVTKNRDIKVWNLSLGSALQVSLNFISPEAAELDRIQSENDVIFIVAGTNKRSTDPENMRIGAPADSINALVVNAVNRAGEAASYRRVGPVLSFFHKPDVSYFGGDRGDYMKVCMPQGENLVRGTSFAAPWITRKVAYLIHNMGFSREVAKALIIDAAANWNRRDDSTFEIGYGVVPKRIEDILQSPDDEIRFIMTGTTDAYETYTYELPVPIHKEKYPYWARATLCYFPKCSRNQGVDYTNTEMDIHFGRVTEDNYGMPKIKSINRNRQGDAGFHSLYEAEARNLFRKWDNIKHISEELNPKSRPKLVYDSGMWGISIKTKERLAGKNGKGMPFGVVVTLKEMNGVNRIDEFIKRCILRGWIVNEVDIVNRMDVYHSAEEDIKFD